MIEILCGDSAELLKQFPDHTFDALCSDPPSGIGFMGKEWDKDKGGRDKWIGWMTGILVQCRRVMKPGAYGWVWALPRTSHWTATACEDAGFTVRDVLVHVFGTGFPKSRSLLKPASEHWILIKAPGELQELRIDENRIGTSKQVPASLSKTPGTINGSGNGIPKAEGAEQRGKGGHNPNLGRWPANFALSHSDECELVGTRQVKGDQRLPQNGSRDGGFADVGADKGNGKPCGPLYGNEEVEAWRCVEGCSVRMLDEQSGERRSAGNYPAINFEGQNQIYGKGIGSKQGKLYSDSGGASRFFYTAKPSRKERNRGCEDLPQSTEGVQVAYGEFKNKGCLDCLRHLPKTFGKENCPRCGSANLGWIPAKNDGSGRDASQVKGNHHPTVKSVALMRHLLRLIAAPGQLVLDPFAGSGTTGVACIEEGMDFVGIEEDPTFVEIARARCKLNETA